MEGIEYNKIAISDVREILSQLSEIENTDIIINSVNVGHSYDAIVEVTKAYSTIQENIQTLIKQTGKMIDDVIAAVNEIDG